MKKFDGMGWANWPTRQIVRRHDPNDEDDEDPMNLHCNAEQTTTTPAAVEKFSDHLILLLFYYSQEYSFLSVERQRQENNYSFHHQYD